MSGSIVNLDSQGNEFKGFDYLEFYVGNARQAAHYYRTAFGFTPIAYCGPETGVRDRVSIVVEQRDIRFVLTSALTSTSEIAAHFSRHDDGVKDIALTVDDSAEAFHRTVFNGASPVSEPVIVEDAFGRFVKSSVSVFGDTVHSFIERKNYTGNFAPGFQALNGHENVSATGLDGIDHLAISVEPGGGDKWVEFYAETFGLNHTQREDISSEYSGMKTDVVRNRTNGKGVVLVIVEPVTGQRRSPIDEYLMYYDGPGVHHIGLNASDIVTTVGMLRRNGVGFARTPGEYYDALDARVGAISVDGSQLRENEILVDRDEWGYLLQIFAKPAQSRPTFFFEIIQRNNAQGFGNGNIKALYEAIEREQLARGNT